MRMLKYSLILTALVVIAGNTAARAGEITFGSSAETNYFCSNGSNIFLTSSSSCVAGSATFHDGAGVYFASPGNPVLQGQSWSLVFPSAFSFVITGQTSSSINNDGGTSFSWGSDPANSLAGTINWVLVKDHTTVPNLVGTLVSPTGGTGLLATDFPASEGFMITLILDTSGYLDALQCSPANTNVTARLSIAEVQSAPEPATFILVGLGLLLAGGLIKKRIHE